MIQVALQNKQLYGCVQEIITKIRALKKGIFSVPGIERVCLLPTCMQGEVYKYISTITTTDSRPFKDDHIYSPCKIRGRNVCRHK